MTEEKVKVDSAKNYFSPEEKERIRLAVSAAEEHTSGEIVIMVVERSDSYREAGILGAVLCAALVALILAVASHHVTIWTYLPLTLLLYYPSHLLVSTVTQLQRPFIANKRLSEAVRERAVRAFYEKGLYRTLEETGILIFISLFERKVWILGDRGINARIPQESWQQFAHAISTGIKDGQACDALCTVIGTCGEVLARHFPQKPGDTNELPDDVIM
jgi:putative membrane protein